MSNEISRKTRLKIYALSLKLHKNKGFSPYKIAKLVNKKFGIDFCVKNIYNRITRGWIPLDNG